MRPSPALMCALALSLGIALSAAAGDPPPALAVADAPPTFRLVSYNIRYDNPADDPPWPVRAPHLAAQTAFLDADVIGLQEALPPMVATLAAAWGGHDHYGVGRDDGAGAGETTTIFWRRDRFEVLARETAWCSPTPDRPSPGWDAALPRTVTRVVLRDRRSRTVLDVRNAHFDHVGVEARARCAAWIAAQPAAVVDGRPALRIVMGDLNTGPDSDPYRTLIAAGLSDARQAAPVRFGPEGTFNGFDATRGPGLAPIDHIFTGPGLQPIRSAVLTDTIGGKVISDHYPVVVDVAADGA
ncbi:MAG TPA: endonuclease/exonuclease/phosphatase family protein [Brevundimonas sp.]|uniref:endonuclease/exonuclease/phosphatase family protein n=1 Tax=Brevundimonas sp. TaxID=1871086 RepID=UPI002E11A987|nr:endonuclease/exonuclease/phosphatase family protein [Brevundimonas sp.]